MIPIGTITLLIKLLTALSVVSIVYIYVLRLSKVMQTRAKTVLSRKLQYLLAKVIIKMEDLNPSELEWDSDFNSLRQATKLSPMRKILFQEMVRLTHILSGPQLKLIRVLFFSLKLQRHAIRRVKSNRFRKKMEGIKLLSGISFAGASKYFTRLSRHKNQAIRAEAIISNIQFSETPFDFFDNTTTFLTRWEAINIQSHLKKLPPEKIPCFGQWLHHPVSSVRYTCLVLIREHRQYEAEHSLRQLLAHTSDDRTIKLILDIVDELNLTGMEKDLIQKLRKGEIKGDRLLRATHHVLSGIATSSKKQRTLQLLFERHAFAPVEKTISKPYSLSA